MTEMIAAEPALAERILTRLAPRESSAASLAAEVRAVAEAGEPIVVTGCGTSEHAALGVAEILRDAMHVAGLPTNPGSPIALQAFEVSLAPQASGLLIGVSHEGGTRATIAALEAVRGSATRTALITAADGSPGALAADVVVATGRWTSRGATPWATSRRSWWRLRSPGI
jgi:fructoselysine-6-P-deglycase FrlB-like protein